MDGHLLSRICQYGRLDIVRGDLLRQKSDVIVTPASNRLAGQEGLDAKIHAKAGPELLLACQQIAKERRVENKPPSHVGETVVTEGFNTDAKWILHTVAPDCRRPRQDDNRRKLLKEAYDSLFEAMKELGEDRVVSPPLSIGTYAYPPREGARYTLDYITEWLERKDNPVKEFVLIIDDNSFLTNLKTVYRESEDQLPGVHLRKQK